MAQYKRIPYQTVEHTEIARKSYQDYEREKDAPDEVEIEAEWIAKRERLYKELGKLTPRQQEAYVMKIAHRMTEAEIAGKLNISQATVSQHYQTAVKKLVKSIGEIADT